MHSGQKKLFVKAAKATVSLTWCAYTDPSFFCDRFHFIKAFDKYKTKARVQVGWRRQIYEPAEARPRMTKRHPIDQHLPLMHRRYKKMFA
jgi:hypothetical protein